MVSFAEWYVLWAFFASLHWLSLQLYTDFRMVRLIASLSENMQFDKHAWVLFLAGGGLPHYRVLLQAPKRVSLLGRALRADHPGCIPALRDQVARLFASPCQSWRTWRRPVAASAGVYGYVSQDLVCQLSPQCLDPQCTQGGAAADDLGAPGQVHRSPLQTVQ